MYKTGIFGYLRTSSRVLETNCFFEKFIIAAQTNPKPIQTQFVVIKKYFYASKTNSQNSFISEILLTY